MNNLVETSETAFQWAEAVSHFGYCIVPKANKFRIFSPDADLLSHEFDSLEEAKLQAVYYFLEGMALNLLSDWYEENLLTSDKYNEILQHLSSRSSDSIWDSTLKLEKCSFRVE